MHVPDGFLDAPTSVATGVVAAGALAVSLRRASREIRETGPALPGLVAAFIFAVQMVNFPIGAGTSGHLLGGALAAALVGPWTGVLCMAVVLIVQALLFADGGLTALGTNVIDMGLTTVLVGFVVMTVLLRLLPQRRGAVAPVAGVAAFLSVPVAAVVFTLLYAVGGAVPIPLGQLATAMIGWHVLIGIGEGLITAAVVGAVMASRPDLVHAARHLRRDLVLVDADGNPTATVSAQRPGTHPVGRRPLAIGMAVTALVAGGLSYFASAHPDGLEYVAEQLGIAPHATESAAAGSPLAGYGVEGLGSSWLSGGLAGIIGAVVVLGLLWAVASVVRRHRAAHEPAVEREPDRVEA
jgi:cobalt/nickel transport system permease protein